MAERSRPGAIEINRAPVMTLWATAVAQRLGHSRATALTLAKAVTGLNAQAKGRRLHVFEPAEPAAECIRVKRAGERVEILGRQVPVRATPRGVLALDGGKVMDPAAVQRYLEQKFGEHLTAAEEAMRALARSRTRAQLRTDAYALYEAFRPAIPEGVRGWGAKGVLDLHKVRGLARARK